MPTQGWIEKKPCCTGHQAGFHSSIAIKLNHHSYLMFLDSGNSLNASWLTRTRGVPSKHFVITATYSVCFQRKYLLFSINSEAPNHKHTYNPSLITWLSLPQAGSPILKYMTSQLMLKILRNNADQFQKSGTSVSKTKTNQNQNQNQNKDGTGL